MSDITVSSRMCHLRALVILEVELHYYPVCPSVSRPVGRLVGRSVGLSLKGPGSYTIMLPLEHLSN